MSRPVVLVVLDGWGIEVAHEHNGIAQATTHHFDELWESYPHTVLHTSGEHVGLPEGQMGNSEVGHTTIGAGTVIFQDLVRINKDISLGNFRYNQAFLRAIDHAKDNNSQLHIIGLFSAGGVHAHEDHFIEIMRVAHEYGVEKIVLHPILDGRDVAPTAGKTSLTKLKSVCLEIKGCSIATIMGRFYAMDRDTNWDRTDKAVRAIFASEGGKVQDIEDAIQSSYDAGTFDEHIEPIIVSHKPIQPNDAMIFTNFRTDRTKQLSQKISQRIGEYNLCFATMTDYGHNIESIVAYEPQSIENTLASIVAGAGLKQTHIAETEKYPHATYFLNGGKEEPHDNEEHVLIPSHKVTTHDLAPEMKAAEITDAAIERLDSNDFLFINYANADMVGHTAKREAILKAVETVDRQLKRLTQAVLERGGQLLVIADHGNAERMIDQETGEPHTAHTTNVVPCILISHSKDQLLREEGSLKDVAPTILEQLGLSKPNSMTGISLIKK